MATAGIFCSTTMLHELVDLASAIEQGIIGVAVQVDEGHRALWLLARGRLNRGYLSFYSAGRGRPAALGTGTRSGPASGAHSIKQRRTFRPPHPVRPFCSSGGDRRGAAVA